MNSMGNLDAGASASTEQNKAFRNFKSSPDVESFYRYVHDNSLRKEAKMILAHIVKSCQEIEKKKAKAARKRKKATAAKQ
jgi:hypothetical protein